MPVVSMMRIPGDAKELEASAREHLTDVTERLGEKHGRILSIAAKTDDGLLLINLWEHEEGRHAMAEEPEIQDALRAAGFPPPSFEAHEVVWSSGVPAAART
ncbi:MAG: hypothetical protein E6G08_19465 [Actinobacteria bacterium]|nr:MAG: hypothetical protein E6G08_19465 [Actinomycetota bacterium]